MSDETIGQIIDLLTKVQDILVKEIDTPHPEMDVTEWNATPVGRAVGLISDVYDILNDE